MEISFLNRQILSDIDELIRMRIAYMIDDFRAVLSERSEL